jgi:transcriptional regulator GlxA family with amidase domain
LIEGFAPKRRRLAVVAFDGVVLGDLAVPCELFGRVRDGAGRAAYEVRLCSRAPEVQSQHALLTVPHRLAWLARADTIIVPGIEDIDRPLPAALLRALRRAVARGARVASICSGAFILAAAGILDGRRATTHWRSAAELARRYPLISVDAGVLYVDNDGGRILTSAGAAAGLDLCLHLVRCDLGAAVAAEVARAAVMPLERAGGQSQFIAPEPPPHDGSAIGRLLAWLEQNLRKDLPLPVMARRTAMSTRNFSRRFRVEVGMTPARWLTQARVRRAQLLLETSDVSVERLAAEVGFRSAAVLRVHFGAVVGTSPQAYRRAFNTSG